MVTVLVHKSHGLLYSNVGWVGAKVHSRKSQVISWGGTVAHQFDRSDLCSVTIHPPPPISHAIN